LCCDDIHAGTCPPPAGAHFTDPRTPRRTGLADRGGGHRDRARHLALVECRSQPLGTPHLDRLCLSRPRGRDADRGRLDRLQPEEYLSPRLHRRLVNTLRVAVIGIVLATVLGTIVGIARLSSNWLLSRLAAVYVELLRDLPLLLQLLFWYVLMQGLPAARAAWMPIDGVYLSNRGLILPSISIEQGIFW